MNKILALFFSRAVTLEQWVESGLFEREKIIYEKHLKKKDFDEIYWFTYGMNDAAIARKLKCENRLHEKIKVFPMPQKYDSKIGMIIYSCRMSLIYKAELKKCYIKKSNQMDGAWSAYIAKKITGGIFVLRTGYTLSAILNNDRSCCKTKKAVFRGIEHYLYRKADISFVSSKHDKKFVCSNYGIDDSKVHLLRNYIDTSIFYNYMDKELKDRFIFIGRLNNLKNLFNTISAVCKTGKGIDLYGKGELEDSLQNYIKINGLDAEIKGYIPNSDLPNLLNKYKYFILASNIEGMPKALLEAMACGRICIGTDVEGINEIIDDGYNGFLAKTTEVNDIVDAIKRAVNCECVNAISQNAESLIKKKYDIKKIIDVEMMEYKKYENIK